MIDQKLLCTDLDRTLLPNGAQQESPEARTYFSKLVTFMSLAYVTGRNKLLVEEAIESFDLPLPRFVIADVGATIFEIIDGIWIKDSTWENILKESWKNCTSHDISKLFNDYEELVEQPIEHQSDFKLSYYSSLDKTDKITTAIYETLSENNISTNIICSSNPQTALSLIDILPPAANKVTAIKHIINKYNFHIDHTVFSGDSGNDMAVFKSDIHSIVVANAEEAIKKEVIEKNYPDNYIAKGNYLGMNGNYSAGIIEGVVHFFPEIHHLLEV